MNAVFAVALLLAPAAASTQQRPAAAGFAATGASKVSDGTEAATIMVEPVGMMIAGFDTDGDARVSRAELAAGVARSFASIDTGGSGAIGYIPFADWAERWLGDRNALPSPYGVDSDGDNRISLAELQAAIGHIFARFDADRDGFVTRAELLTIRAAPGNDAGGRRR